MLLFKLLAPLLPLDITMDIYIYNFFYGMIHYYLREGIFLITTVGMTKGRELFPLPSSSFVSFEFPNG